MTALRACLRRASTVHPFASAATRHARRSLSLASTLHAAPKDRKDPRQTPILFLHGLFGSKQNNRSISKAIARDLGVDIYALDLRNHGDSPHDAQHDYVAMAADVAEFMETNGLPKVTLIGHSMGAKAAMTLALQAPEKVQALIPVDNAPVDAALKSDFGKYVQGMRQVLQAGVSKQSEADEILQQVEKNDVIRLFLLTNLTRDPDTKKLKFRVPLDILGKSLDKLGDFPFKDPGERRFDGPTLVIRGTKSHYVADDVLPLVGEFFPRFELRDIDCGHWVISEKPEEFRRAVVDFLQVDE